MRFLSILGALALVACSGANSVGVVIPPAYSIGVVSADTVDTVATPTAVIVQVQDKNTLVPASGVIVNFVVVKGGGSTFAGTGLTDAQGQVREIWTLGQVADTQCLEGRAVDPATGQPIVYARACLLALAGPLTTLQVDSTPVHLVIGDSVDVGPRVGGGADQYGNPIALTPTWSLPPGWQQHGSWVIATAAYTGDLAWSSGKFSGTIAIVSVPNWISNTFALDLRCQAVMGGVDQEWTGASDSVRYKGQPGYFTGGSGEASPVQWFFTVFDHSGQRFVTYIVPIDRVAPDTVYFAYNNTRTTQGYYDGKQVVGANLCSQAPASAGAPVFTTLTQQ